MSADLIKEALARKQSLSTDKAEALGLVFRDGEWRCPKCRETSGNAWEQCGKRCPIATSPWNKPFTEPTEPTDLDKGKELIHD
jgi:hypothetical protein